jgi:hypothetical protein
MATGALWLKELLDAAEKTKEKHKAQLSFCCTILMERAKSSPAPFREDSSI